MEDQSTMTSAMTNPTGEDITLGCGHPWRECRCLPRCKEKSLRAVTSATIFAKRRRPGAAARLEVRSPAGT
jgi:hypothetical protein